MLERNEKLASGIKGFDEILMGGFVPYRSYLLRGMPGTGKTAIGMHFLSEGVKNNEKVLFINMGEPTDQVISNAQGMGFDTEGIDFLDLSPDEDFFANMGAYNIFSPVEVERESTTSEIMEIMEIIKPTRVFLDPITQFRYLSTDEFQFRKQVLSFLRFLTDKGATVLFTSEFSDKDPDDDLQFMCDGIINLKFFPEGRSISISKYRGSGFRFGAHSMRITRKGVMIYPRLRPMINGIEYDHESISSGVPEIDELLHGGIERGTATIISGPSGVGKTTVGIQFMKEAAGRGERSVVYTFEESEESLINRCESINIPVRSMIKTGMLSVVQVEPLRYSPEEFAQLVRKEVDENQSKIVMIDSTSGYKLSLRGEDPVSHLHSLSKYMTRSGVTVILINEVEDVSGGLKITEIGISYLADNIIFLRYFERRGELRKTIGVLKKRLSDFEKNLREFRITQYGIRVDQPLTSIKGVLSGTPEHSENQIKE
ncbi:ATPase domain-containing protein [Methanobacterium petrolearium]|uniref:ATPase domain-containing protein n=1 Tax=Methanobacterium petrolearium TaxID=710190 RepID=UPI001AE45157|nr:ATPase domain-containing protein [Methanobacterium petrolearium]MBP1945430.1 circadian clock protein KaiC [Methanobacterium petrolearium]BDZ71628.1 serine/threonine protein kinase [Methanobacterium petrolearium]